MRAGWALVASLGCAPAGPAPGSVASERTVTEPTADPLPNELRGLVSPWHRIDPEWLTRASVWAVGSYAQRRVHQQRGRPGYTAWILLDAFMPTKVLRGSFAAPEILLEAYALRGPAYPPNFDEQREYLVLLRPSPETATRLADPQNHFTMYERLGPDEVVAIIDLSQSAAEARTAGIVAERSGEQAGARFDPQLWAAARAAPTITAQQHAPVGQFLAATLKLSMTIDEARAWVGEPDEQIGVGTTQIDRYWLARPEHLTPRVGGIYGQIELRHVDARLTQGDLRYFQWSVTPDGHSSVEMTDEQLRPLGLTSHVLAP